MENSETYQILRTLIEKNLLVIRHKEFVNLLNNLQSKGQIAEEEIKDLLALAEHLKIYDLPISE